MRKRAEGESDGGVKVNRNTLYGYATSGGVGAYEVKGELNGVFMKYLRRRIGQSQPVQEMLRRVFRGWLIFIIGPAQGGQ